ncbi:MAG TPA: alanine racemase [Candidatus Elarobacter sp.]
MDAARRRRIGTGWVIAELTVDLGALARNAQALARLVAPARLTAVVKANAYGHGLVPAARALAPHAARLSVYALDEAVALRDAGIDAPIHVLGPIPPDQLDVAHAANVQITVWDAGLYARQVASVARRRRRTFAVQAKIDTGVVRLGLDPSAAPAALQQYVSTPEIELAGAFTHLAAAEEIDSGFTLEQLARFLRATEHLGNGVERHTAATAAAILWPETRLDAVRCGIGLYGIWPSAESEALMRARGLVLEPALSWRTRIVALHDVGAETTVGYGRTWRAARPSRIATLPIGYAEGLPRAASNAAHALVRGRRVPLVGRVCMDMAFLDVTDVPDAANGDAVTLIGTDGGERITAEELAAACGTIGYEIVARLPADVPRSFLVTGT